MLMIYYNITLTNISTSNKIFNHCTPKPLFHIFKLYLRNAVNDKSTFFDTYFVQMCLHECPLKEYTYTPSHVCFFLVTDKKRECS